MTLQTLSVTNLKQQIYLLVDRLPPEQLPRLLHFIEQWLEQDNRSETNGATLNLPSTSRELSEADQPWLRYTAKLKDSPNWDKFLEALAETRHAVDEDDAGK
jgi:hypothetical protein